MFNYYTNYYIYIHTIYNYINYYMLYYNMVWLCYPQTESLGFVITVQWGFKTFLYYGYVLFSQHLFNKFINLKPKCLSAKNCLHRFSFWLDNQANKDRQMILQIKIKENWEGGGWGTQQLHIFYS